MRRRRVIASLMLCLLLAGTTLAAADPDRGRDDRRNDRESKSEEKSQRERSRKQRDVRRGDGRDRRVSDRQVSDRRVGDRYVVETRREPARTWREGSRVYPRTNEHVVSRTATPSGWHNRAVRGHAQYATWDGYRARRWASEHRTWRARGGYHGYWIPENRYQVVFGPRHRFRIDNCPLVVVSGYPRFYYGGYWVTFIDPWPEYWPDYWFAEDDCYVVYDYDGYYLMNARHPSVRIAVSFTLS
jgi:hypothetical protein